MGLSWADNSIEIWRNLPISNPKPDLHNINAHTKFGENPLMFTQVIIQKIWACLGQKFDKIRPLAIPNQIHIPSLVEIHWGLLKLSSGNKKWTDVCTTDGWTDTQMSNLKPYYPATIVWWGIKRKADDKCRLKFGTEDWIHYIFLLPFLQGRQLFCDFLFTFLHKSPFWKQVCSKRKEFAPTLKGKNILQRGANSFLSEQIPLKKGAKTILTVSSPECIFDSPHDIFD